MPLTEADHDPRRRAMAASREALAASDTPYGATLAAADGRLLQAEAVEVLRQAAR